MSKAEDNTRYFLALSLTLTLVLVGPVASAKAAIVDVTIHAQLWHIESFEDCAMGEIFGAPSGYYATVIFRLDTSDPIIIPAGTQIGHDDFTAIDLYGYPRSALSEISATYGNKTWEGDAVLDVPLGAYNPDPSVVVWFNGRVTVGGNVIPNMAFRDISYDGREEYLALGPLGCEWNGYCYFRDVMFLMEEKAPKCIANGYAGPLLFIEIVGDPDGEDVDECPNSDLSATVVIDYCDSGITNTLFPTGCTISDLIEECAEDCRIHGQFMSCVDKLLNDLKKAGTITVPQKNAIKRCASHADIP